jgi:uncharacterized repeat protein (TIGR02543 family)
LTVSISKADQAAPALPNANSVGAFAVTLDTVDGCEYSMNNASWQDSAEFNGLTQNTEYTFYQRFKGSESYNASDATSITLTTLNAYTVTLHYGTGGTTIITVEEGNSLNLHNPTVDGYVFMGWYSDADYQTEFVFPDIISSSFTAYAKFTDLGDHITIDAAKMLINQAKTELQTAIDTKADAATITAKLEELSAAISAAETAAKDYADGNTEVVNATIAELRAAVDVLEKAKSLYIDADTELKSELESSIDKAKQESIAAAKGHIPFIGSNGNWWIGDVDTGIKAEGKDGKNGEDAMITVPTVIASASMLVNVAIIAYIFILKRKKSIF